ncbi:MAG TPA: LamG-like jellyroll fold domain-containing protein [Candidatus Acidoferrum sp.]|nr:LamG-like jellyroll fold domain-containing protein [Candidatus Acidoferrum sp.]
MKPTRLWPSGLRVALVASLVIMAGTSAHADSSYKSAVLADGPLTYHRFSEANVVSVPYPVATNSGTLGAAANGTPTSFLLDDPILVGDPGALTTDPSETAYTFPGPAANGNLNTLEVPWQPTLADNGPFTVEFWAKPAGNDFTCPAAMIDFYQNDAADRYGWLVYQSDSDLNTGNGWMIRLYAGNGTSRAGMANYDMTVVPGTWYHLAFVYTGSAIRLYVNGVKQDDEAASGYQGVPSWLSSHNLCFGSRGDTTGGTFWEYPGSLDEIVYYTNALTDTDVLNHYNAASTMTGAAYASMILTNNPPGYWKLNEQPVIPPVAANSGSGGTAFNAQYEYGSTTTNELDAPTYPGLETTNRALSLNSSLNGFVRIPPLDTTMSSATFECLINPDGGQAGYAGLILHRDDPNYATHGLTFGGDGSLSYTWNWAANTYNWYSGLYPTPGQWSYVAVTISPTQAKMCLFDGTTWQVAVNSVNHSPGTFDVRTAIGQDDNNPGTRNFNGLLDEAAIYNKALTEGQLHSHALAAFTAGVAPQFVFDPPTVAPSATVMATTSFTLTSDAYGKPSPTFQWQHAGTNIPGATSAIFTKARAAVTDSGNYQVIAANASSSITGTPVAITVYSLPPNATNALCLWLKLDEATGVVARDSSTNGLNGALINFPGDNSEWVSGAIGGALGFNPPGSSGDEYVDVPDSNGTLDFSSSMEFSLSAWVKAGPAQTAGAPVICNGTGGGGEQYCLDVPNGAYRFYTWDTSGTPYVYQTSVAPNNNWQHVVVSFSKTLNAVSIYVNGALVQSGTPPATMVSNGGHDVTVGSRQSGGDVYDLNLIGTIDDVRVFSRALSQDDVALLYNNALPIRLTMVQQPQPASRAVLPGGSVTFNALVTGAPIAYQWRLGGMDVPGATNASLTVVASPATVGSYTLIAANSANSVTSSPAVTVSLIPMPAVGYVAGVVADKPEAYWRLDETSAGTVSDSMGRHDGWMSGSVSLSQPGVLAGDGDTCMSFSQGYVNVPYSPALNTKVFSIECWAQYQGASPLSDYYCAVSSVAWGNSGYLIYAAADNFWEAWLGESSGNWCFNHGSAVTSNAWAHLVSVFDGTNSAMYVNGTLGQLVTPGGTVVQNSTMPLAIGWNDAAGGYYFTGPIDEVAFYPSALTPERVMAHYQLGISGTNSQPLFVTEPVSQTVEEGLPASFSPALAGASPMSYQWKQAGLNVTGATAQTLTFASVDYANAGPYTLAATNNYGGAVSAAASLTVLPPASVTNLTARISQSPTGTKLELIWPLGYTLYCATNTAAPAWLPVAGATAPYYNVPVSTSIPQMYFKIR